MKTVLVTGTLGLSRLIADRFQSEPEFSTLMLDLWTDDWKQTDFPRYDSIVHVVGVTPQSIKNDEDYERINVRLTEELAKRAKAAGVKQFVFISSMAVYGTEQQMDPVAGTVTETTPCAPNSEYGQSKLQAEQLLNGMQDDAFSVVHIRVPSIYGEGKTTYLDQYRYLADKLPVIPDAFRGRYKSILCVKNLCELIFLIVKENATGVFCPDDGEISATMLCRAIYPRKKLSRLLGRGMELILKKNERIRDYYGAICYSRQLANCFDGRYRVLDFREAVRRCYSENH